MLDHRIRKRIANPEAMKDFTGMGYRFNPTLTKGDTWVFTRDEAP